MSDATQVYMEGPDAKRDPKAQKMRADAQAKRERAAKIKAEQDRMMAEIRKPRPPKLRVSR